MWVGENLGLIDVCGCVCVCICVHGPVVVDVCVWMGVLCVCKCVVGRFVYSDGCVDMRVDVGVCGGHTNVAVSWSPIQVLRRGCIRMWM